jgi:hypothetical protein
MARLYLVSGTDPLVCRLAEEIIAGQQAEITAMKAQSAIRSYRFHGRIRSGALSEKSDHRHCRLVRARRAATWPPRRLSARRTHGVFRVRPMTAGQAMPKNTICLWYDKEAEAAARFYAATFPDSALGAVHHAPSDYPSGKKGDVLTSVLTDALAAGGDEAKRAFDAMMGMKKIDVAAIKAARRG